MNTEKQKKSVKKMQPVCPAAASALIWGSGQLWNKEYIKALFFFLLQLSMVCIEICTGKYFVGSYSIRENGGFFIKGIWGLITLGTKPRTLTLAGVTEGDHSIILMIRGIIAVLVFLIYIVIIYGM